MRLLTGRTGWSRGRCATATGLVVALAGLAGACGSSPTETDLSTTAGASETDFSILGDFTESLELTDDQIAALRDVLEEYRGQGRQRGALWNVAADLQGILSSEQVDAIAARQAELGARMRARRGEAMARREKAPSHREWRRQVGQDEMVEALRLNTDQLAAIEALRERSGSAGRPSPEEAKARREEHHQALLDILDDDQEEIWILHGSLLHLFARHQDRGRTGDGRGRPRRLSGAPIVP